jgi:hypothetical protein
MRWELLLALLFFAPSSLLAGEDCGPCHVEAQRQFAATAMANATQSEDFKIEWAQARHSADCLFCHAPSGGTGLGCADCHGSGEHPYGKLTVLETCASCHDAPGEATVRSHKISLAARQKLNCLSCHVKSETGGHAFLGATTPGFLEGSVRLFLALRKEQDGQVLDVAVRPRAGHAVPGGTTGRSVWLVVRGLDRANSERWRKTQRFGWLQGPGGVWEDATLAPEIGANLLVPEPGRKGTQRVEAELIYRFRPGPLEEPDPRAVLLSKAQMTLH